MKTAIVDLEPKNKKKREDLAVENFRLDVQYAILDVMNQKGVSRRQLSEKLGVSEARISQIFSDSCNVTVRLLGRIFHALGESMKILPEAEIPKCEACPIRQAWHADIRGQCPNLKKHDEWTPVRR